jgi:signal-transduction protein with cAMP-binding, CBS, and nucleotidyltransferase domain
MLDSTGNHKRTSKPGGSLRQCCMAISGRWLLEAAIRSGALRRCGRERGICGMNVSDGMTKVIVSVGPAHTLREAAQRMSASRVGAAVVVDSEQPGIGILTERDILDSVAAGQDPDAEMVADHRTSDVVFASPDWTLEQAAVAMTRGNFRHLIVVEGTGVSGLLSMRDIVRCWTVAGAVAVSA